jgi:hydrogenase maturation protein HypF
VISLNSLKIQAKINITGRVQGVGFRPFIYRVAVKNRLLGYVINLGDAGVEIVVEGSRKDVENFIRDVESNAPKVSEIEDINIKYREFKGKFTSFRIEKSESREQVASGIFPPDISICSECLMDIETPEGRWYNYPFTACAWCGPRFTSVKALPYDRERTHMFNFPMCKNCFQDYYDPLNRRFDAQGITCVECGPKMILYDATGKVISVENVFKETSNRLKDGKIIAIKGIGGIHLASVATRDDVVNEFRQRKDRENQPFALLSPNLDTVKLFADINTVEEKHLTSWRKPIVLLKKKNKLISDLVAPGLKTVGVMLPYTGIQTMIFKHLNEPAIIMTSGNRKGLPIVIKNKDAFNELEGLADYFLMHDREIVNRSDDSVLRIINGNPAFIRRSRGYVPEAINSPINKGIATALGAELRNAAAIATDGKVYLTQYLGDVTSLEGLEFEQKAIQTLRDLLNITCNPDVIACDLHPEYLTSQYGEVISQETEVPLFKSQHHHAHITSVMAEHGILDCEIIGIALDGAGYGQDRQIWGGEVLKTTYIDYQRLGHLEYLPMPGGDLCAHYPYRMLIAGLTKSISDDEIRDITLNHINHALPHKHKELSLILKQSRYKNILKTSSFGRVLDSISSLIGLTYYRSYEGEPAMRLESLASKGDANKIDFSVEISYLDGKYILNTSNMLYYLINNIKNHNKEDIAAFSQKYLSDGLTEIALNAANDSGIETFALSGGVFVNDYITSYITNKIEKEGYSVIRNQLVPPGDGGIALGQAASALHYVI